MKSPSAYLICDFLLKTAAILAAIAITIGTIGIPLPVRLVTDLSAPFPCMNCGCGCVSADICWRQCCCLTNTQKLAWANSHGVKVPDGLLDQVADESGVDCSDLNGAQPCCRQRIVSGRIADAGTSERASNSASIGRKHVEEPPFVPGILALHVLKCQGNSVNLSLLPPSIPTDEIGTDRPLGPQESLSLVECIAYQPPHFDAVVPPPEFADF